MSPTILMFCMIICIFYIIMFEMGIKSNRSLSHAIHDLCSFIFAIILDIVKRIVGMQTKILLRGYYTFNLKLACIVYCLKIINTLKNNVCILKHIVQGTQKWH